MFTLGQKLKDARIRKGYSITDISNKTKIQERYIEALENGKLDILPGHFYARTFIKQYADVVGFDSIQMVREFDELTVDLHSPNHLSKGRFIPKSIKESKSGTWATIKESLPLIMLSSLMLAIVIVVYVAGRNLTREAESPYIHHEGTETRYIEDAVIEDNPEDLFGQAIQLDHVEEDVAFFAVTGDHPEEQLLTVKVKGDASTVSVADKEDEIELVLDESEVYQAVIPANVRELFVDIQNSETTVVSLNGQPIKLPPELRDLDTMHLILEFVTE